MARRDPHEERWAAMVVEAAHAWGHPGRSFHDRKRGVVTFVGLGDVPLDDPDGRIANYVHEEQRNEMFRRCHRLLEQQFLAPSEWVTGDAELDRAIRRELIAVRQYPESARGHAGVAFFGRQLGIDGWRERWRWAAARYVADGLAKGWSTAVVTGVLMWIEIGETERVAATADLMLRRFDPAGEQVDLATVDVTQLNDLVLALWWRDGRAALASLVDRRPRLGGNTMVEAFALAAVAAETGLADELREQLGRLEQMGTSWEREIGPHAAHDGHQIRYLVEVVRSWYEELDPGAPGAEPAQPTRRPTSSNVSDAVAAAGVTRLAWRGDVLVAEGAVGSVAIDPTGVRVLAPPAVSTDESPADRVRRVGEALVVERGDGTVISLRSEWDEDQLEDGENYEVTWSRTGDRVAVWGEYGPVVVFAPDGSPAGEFLDHWKGPTYGVELVGGRMMSWARDGRAVVYDLERRLVVGAVQMDGWPDDATIHGSGRIVLTRDNVADWLAHDIDTGDRLGPCRPAVRALAHPTQPLVGYADADQIWVEEYVCGDA